MIPTPHIEVKDKHLIAKTVLMPGDPLRAEAIANKYLTEVKKVNGVRNMLAFTGKFGKKLVTVMGSGMGMPSIGIYSYELYKFYDVQTIIRVGSCGAYTSDLKLYDVVLVSEAHSESSYAKIMGVTKAKKLPPSKLVNNKLVAAAHNLHIPIKIAPVHSSDNFYFAQGASFSFIEYAKKTGAIAVEMESFALFANAKALGKRAACILTVSDSLITHEQTTSQERQSAFNKMVEIALNSI